MDHSGCIGLIGLGYWGKNLLRDFRELGVLGAACDMDPDTLSRRREEFPDVSFCTGPESLFEDTNIKAVAVASPAATHYDLAKRALQSGKDVFVEKPLALNLQEGAELVSMAKERGRILMVGHVLHYHPAVRKLREIVRGGGLGELRYIYSNRLNMGKVRAEEDIWWSFAPHDISMVLMLAGREPARIEAFGGDYLNPGVADIQIASLEFEGGLKGHIFVSWLNPFKEQKLTVIGSEGMAVFDDTSTEKLFLYPHEIKWNGGRVPEIKKKRSEAVPIEPAEPLKDELRHFLHCIASREQPETDGEEGLRVLRVLEAANNKKGPRPVPGKSYFVHRTSFVDEGAEIGEGTRVWHFSHILSGSRVGKNCVIGQNVMIGPDVILGDGCKVQNNVSIYKGVMLEDEVFCGPSSVFTNVYNPRAFIERKAEFRPTLVKKGATIGANATVVCGATIGEYALVGAGAVVKKDVEAYSIVAGVPARQTGWACRCGTTLKDFKANSARCAYCGNTYRVKGGSLVPMEEK